MLSLIQSSSVLNSPASKRVHSINVAARVDPSSLAWSILCSIGLTSADALIAIRPVAPSRVVGEFMDSSLLLLQQKKKPPAHLESIIALEYDTSVRASLIG